MTFGKLSSVALAAGVALYAALYLTRPGGGSLVVALGGPLTLVAFLLALVWGLMGTFRDRSKLLALVVTLVSGAVNAYLFSKIFL